MKIPRIVTLFAVLLLTGVLLFAIIFSILFASFFKNFEIKGVSDRLPKISKL